MSLSYLNIAFLIHKRYISDPEQLNQQRFTCAAQMREPLYTILEQEKQTKLVNLLQSWIDEEDEQEQQETGEYLIEALDQDRLSERPLFPAELKGVTW